MSVKSHISLVNYFVFNSSLGPREGEEFQKILYFYPDDTDIDSKIKTVGLCEALIKFSETFNPDKACHALHTQKRRQFFLQVEPEFWIVMTVSIPCQQKSKDGHIFMEYYGEEVQDHIFQSVLKTSYKMFRLFMGTFKDILLKNSNNYDNLKKRLDHFFKKYLQSLRLSQADLMDVFQGLQFLPLDRQTFLRIRCFVNLIQATFKEIKYICFLYNDQLVWSGLEQTDMQVLFKYLTQNLIPTYLESEMNSRMDSPSRNALPSSSPGNYARFVTGPVSWTDTASINRIPKVHLYCPQNEVCHLVVYRALSATLCLLVDASHQISMDFFKQLDAVIGPQLTSGSLATDIGEQYLKMASMSSVDPSLRYAYMYFNHMNLAQKSTIHPDFRRTGVVAVAPETLKFLADFNLDLAQLTDSGEVIGKTLSDIWVVGKLSDKREFYVVLLQKNATVVEVSEELKKLNAAHFQNIFILE